MTRKLKRLFTDRNGATAIEYGLIVALVSIAAVGTLTTVGQNLSAVFTSVGNSL